MTTKKRTPLKAKTKAKGKSMTVPTSEIPEVGVLMQADNAVNEFISKHAGLFDELAQLADARNTALQDADKAIRALAVDRGVGIDCGPFRFKHFNRRVNFEKMFDTLEEEDYTKLSGIVSTVPNYTGDRTTVLRAIDNGEVPADVAENFYSNSPTYEAIAELVLP